MHSRFLRWLRRRPYDILLGLLLAVIFADPVLPETPGWRLVGALLVAAIPLAAVIALLENRLALHIGLWLGVPATAAILQDALGLRMVPTWVVVLCPLGIGVVATLTLMRHVIVAPRVDGNTIRGGISGYLMAGYTWSIAYMVASHLHPGSFQFQGVPHEGILPGGMAAYFSFTTLTTLGYGDIVAVHPLARSLAISEAIFGVMYLAITVARLVSTYRVGGDGVPE